jgi:hypothetical protein
MGEFGFRMAGIDVSPSGIKMTQEASAERKIAFDGHVAGMSALPWADLRDLLRSFEIIRLWVVFWEG